MELMVISGNCDDTRTIQSHYINTSHYFTNCWAETVACFYSFAVSESILMNVYPLFLIESITIHWRHIDSMNAKRNSTSTNTIRSNVPIETKGELTIINSTSVSTKNPLLGCLCVFILSKSLCVTSIWSGWYSVCG